MPSRSPATNDLSTASLPPCLPPLSEALSNRLLALGIDAEDPLERASLALVHRSLESALERGLFDPPISEQTKARYASLAAVFENWCATREDPIDLMALSASARVAVVATFLSWLAMDIDPSDPVLGHEFGQRQRTTALMASSINCYVNAIRWWAAEHGIEDPVPTAAADLVAHRYRAVPSRQTAPLGLDEVKVLLATIRQGPAACGDYPREVPMEERRPSRPDRAERWVAGNTAALLVQFCGALRVSERLRLRDEWVSVADDRLILRWPSTKMHPEGRTVDLYGDPDETLCPVRALLRWLEVAERQGLDRKGLLLPDVTTRHLRTKTSVQASVAMFKRIATAAGLPESFDSEHYIIGTHGLRRGRATSLAALGVDLERLRRLLGHAKASTTLRYVDRAVIEAPNWSSELGL